MPFFAERKFFLWAIEASQTGMDLDGGEVQEMAEKLGLVELVVVDEPCGDACVCAEVDDFPLTCYRLV